MLLQRDVPIPVHGTAAPNEHLTLAFANQSRSTSADASGRWSLTLDPVPASTSPQSLVIKASNTITLNNILVGDLWLCSGQSNMEFRMNRGSITPRELPNATHPLLRLLHINRAAADAPRPNVSLTRPWSECSPETVPEFSAVAYFFGRELLNALDTKVPIGLINASWGGTRIESWTSPAGFAAIPELADLNAIVQPATPGTPEHQKLIQQTIDNFSAYLASLRQAAASNALPALPPEFPNALKPISATFPPRGNFPIAPSSLYNAMIKPLLPLPVRGVIWYQGEANRGDGPIYFHKLRAFAAGLRTDFQNPNLPLYIVQVAPFKYNGQHDLLPEIQAAQAKFAATDPHSGIAITNDVGNPDDNHPHDKITVGKRLANQALAKTYGFNNIQPNSPIPSRLVLSKSNAAVLFKYANALSTSDNLPPDWFEIAAADGVFHKAIATINNDNDQPAVLLSSPDVSNPVAVRYAWSGIATPNLRGDNNLPIGPFSLGNLPQKSKSSVPSVSHAPSVRELLASIPESAGYQLIYELDLLDNQPRIAAKYAVNNSKQFAKKSFKRVAYLLQTSSKSGEFRYAFASMDAFTKDIQKIRVPDKSAGFRHQLYVQNLVVASNAPGVKTGSFPKGNIEFWECDYAWPSSAKIPGASDKVHDFGDTINPAHSPGYGCMQIHNYLEKQTVIAYNHWGYPNPDVGIGNNPSGQPDWTHSKNSQHLQSARLLILVK
jgi:sialate O-acetylesterase